jgi:hypothetical protein
MGGKFHLRLNIGKRPIANKYREGKMKRTLKRELKVREIAKREAIWIDYCANESRRLLSLLFGTESNPEPGGLVEWCL